MHLKIYKENIRLHGYGVNFFISRLVKLQFQYLLQIAIVIRNTNIWVLRHVQCELKGFPIPWIQYCLSFMSQLTYFYLGFSMGVKSSLLFFEMYFRLYRLDIFGVCGFVKGIERESVRVWFKMFSHRICACAHSFPIRSPRLFHWTTGWVSTFPGSGSCTSQCNVELMSYLINRCMFSVKLLKFDIDIKFLKHTVLQDYYFHIFSPSPQKKIERQQIVTTTSFIVINIQPSFQQQMYYLVNIWYGVCL